MLEKREMMSADCFVHNDVLYIEGTAEADDIIVYSPPATDQLHVFALSGGLDRLFDLSAIKISRIQFRGYAGNDAFHNGTDIPMRAYGGLGQDMLVGGTADDEIHGG